jgi:hypothetical protein
MFYNIPVIDLVFITVAVSVIVVTAIAGIIHNKNNK